MTSIRLRLKLRGIYMRDSTTVGGDTLISPRYIFTFAGTDYYKILFDSGFSLDATYTTNEIEIWVGGNFAETSESLITTERFIFPLIYKPLAIIDGTVRGSSKIGFESYGGVCEVWLTKIIFSLIKIDSDANETVLGTVTQEFPDESVLELPSTIGNDTTTIVWHAFPYFFDVKNQKIDYNGRLILEIKPYGIITNLGADHGRFYFAAAVDADNQYIDIPMV